MSGDLITEKFDLWTKGLDEKSARISVYENIRDIPYALVAELRDPHTGPCGLLKLNRGSCVPKHFLLALMFERLKIPVKYASYLFKWDDPGIKYPGDLRLLTRRMPVTAHLACKAEIEGRWILLDATWDTPLKKVGFPVNGKWDGVSETHNAVTPIKEIIHSSLEERVAFSAEHRKSYTRDESEAYEEFTKKLNPWLESLRNSRKK